MSITFVMGKSIAVPRQAQRTALLSSSARSTPAAPTAITARVKTFVAVGHGSMREATIRKSGQRLSCDALSASGGGGVDAASAASRR